MKNTKFSLKLIKFDCLIIQNNCFSKLEFLFHSNCFLISLFASFSFQILDSSSDSFSDESDFEELDSYIEEDLIEIMESEDIEDNELADNQGFGWVEHLSDFRSIKLTFSEEEVSQFQRVLWHNTLLPYQAELEKEADYYFSNVKSGIAYSVLMRDSRPGLIIWVCELDRFIKLHSFRFTKQDHINLLNLLYNTLIMKDLDLRVVKILCSSLRFLLSRKALLSRDDVQFNWRPLYDLYVQVAYKNLEEDGVFLVPGDIDKFLDATILDCNRFFPNSATQEILDEARPYLCPWDDTSARAFKILSIFLPTCLTNEEHDLFGAKLWIDELLFFLTSPGIFERQNIFNLFARLAIFSPGYFDFSPYFSFFFTCLLSSLKIEIGVDRVVASNSYTSDGPGLAQILVYSFGMADNKINSLMLVVQQYFDQLFLSLESYFHPSNTGKHTRNLLNFVHRLCVCFVNRVSRERFNYSKRYVNEVPKGMHLTNIQIENFVKSILPCLEYAAFVKQKDDFVPSIIRLLAFLSPGIIVPFVLDLVYPSLQTITEPHRLIQSLKILSHICVVIARDRIPQIGDNVQRLPIKSLEDFEANKRSYRRHTIILMNNLLPGLDVNDVAKCGLVFQILSILMTLVPIVDCSQAPLTCKDLTPEEIDLCSETASFEFFVEELMRKIFSMIMLLGGCVTDRQDLTSTKTVGKNVEEIVIEKGALIVFRALVKNCSSAFYKYITDQYYNFVNEHLFNSKPAMDTITKMVGSIVAVCFIFDPHVQFSRFFTFAVNKFEEHYHVGCEDEEDVDRALIWYISFASEIVRNTPGLILLQNRSSIDSFGKILLVAIFAQNVLNLLCSIYIIPKSFHKLCDQPFDKFLPLRHWAEPVNKDELSYDWHVPSDEEVNYALKLVDQFITSPMQNVLTNFKELTDKEIQRNLKIAHNALTGCSNLCPFFDGEVLSLIPMATPNIVLDVVTVPWNVKKITASDGSNYRTFLFKIVKKTGERLLSERDNDTKSSLELLAIIRILLNERGSTLTSYQYSAASHQMTRKIMNDPLRGFSQTIEPIMDATISLMHTKRLTHRPLVGITSTHVEALTLAFCFATSTYALVRQSAQKLLDSSFNWWTFSYKLFLDDLVQILGSKSSTSYEQFKVKYDLFYIIDNHTSFQIEFKFQNHIFPFANVLIEDYDGNVHKDVMSITQEAIQNSTKREAEINEKRKRFYNQTATALCQVSTNKDLHWRNLEFSRALLSLLLRRDSTLQSNIILHFFQLLIADSLKTRKLAISFCASWFKINRTKAKKIVKNIINGQNIGPGAKWPIKYGIRRDNSFLLYDAKKSPTVQNEWDNAEFLHLPHWGYYIWPKEFKCYAPPSQQDWANRDYSQMNEIEKSIIAIFKDREFLNTFTRLFSLEDEKEDREFDAVNFSLFNRIFRTFNNVLLDEFIEILDCLLKETKASHQRLASEIIAGLISGSKFWKFEKREKLLNLLIPKLEQFLLEIPLESEKYWGSCFATIGICCEPKQVCWLIELFFQLINKPTEISSQLQSRIYLLQSLLSEYEWRVPVEWKRLANFCIKLIDNTFQNVRIRVGSCLATCARFDYTKAFYYPEIEEEFKFLRICEVVDEVNKKLEPLWNEAICSIGSNDLMKHVDSSNILVNNIDELKKEKLSLLTLISFLYSIDSFTGTFTDSSRMRILPLLTHYSNDKTDEELKASCITHIIKYLGLSVIFVDQIDVLFEVCQTIQERGSWKAKITLLRFLQVFVFTNLFILRSKEGSIDILRTLLFKLLIDNRFEVREASAETLSGLVRAGILCVNEQLIQSAEQLSSSPKQSIERHSGVLALAAIVLAFPYSVPSFLPKVLMHLCSHATEPQPIYVTVKRALSEFKRTHQDEWHEHKLEFTEDQLQILTDLIISPNYYV
ncbi:hypothetical protein Mgra_00007634 [Meloidogyne graminicola]|uniref:Proteasome activator complex subunit 4 n=1 Tax=Meloidogyne graminicola TaxID=189291 RepID=A0A8S9ZHT8_9BILA|nr:hypothetical protein Mgra_00007634 [Meloidogyne graminicola]